MTIHVKFFASLREKMGYAELTLSSAASAADVWAQSTDSATPPDNMLVAINLEYAQLDDAVHEGDEIAFFPPVTGG